jgi:hypothetical protein
MQFLEKGAGLSQVELLKYVRRQTRYCCGSGPWIECVLEKSISAKPESISAKLYPALRRLRKEDGKFKASLCWKCRPQK